MHSVNHLLKMLRQESESEESTTMNMTLHTFEEMREAAKFTYQQLGISDDEIVRLRQLARASQDRFNAMIEAFDAGIR